MSITLESISPFIGNSFMVQTTEGQVELVLVEAKELIRKGLPEQFRTPLSLIFRGPDNVTLDQDNYQISHSELGHHVWCIVPVLPTSTVLSPGQPMRPDYQVLFS